MVNFDIKTANADQLVDEIIRVTLTEYHSLGEKIDEPNAADEERDVVGEMVDKYIDNERKLNAYFRKLKRMLRKSPPSPKELERKERQIYELIKKNGLA